MKTFKKYAILALLSISMLAPLSVYATEIKNSPAPAIQQVESTDSTDLSTETIESIETTENIEPAKKVPWYKNPYVIMSSGIIAGYLVAAYLVQPWIFARQIAQKIAQNDTYYNIILDCKQAQRKANDDLARYKEIAKNSADYDNYRVKRGNEFITEVKTIYKKYGMPNATVRQGKPLNDNTINTYVF